MVLNLAGSALFLIAREPALRRDRHAQPGRPRAAACRGCRPPTRRWRRPRRCCCWWCSR
ncbi:MAG: hypothetical protein MZV65_00205 [Chromatiales bacterium]|nr:hypothetical protein [Chromatiales bacterium]